MRAGEVDGGRRGEDELVDLVETMLSDRNEEAHADRQAALKIPTLKLLDIPRLNEIKGANEEVPKLEARGAVSNIGSNANVPLNQ
jgi:hypothetical protein